MKHTESNIQKAFFRAIFASRLKGYVWSTPNGGYRNKITASNMRAEGQLAGVWDVKVEIPSHGYHGMYIEFKRPPQKSAEKRLTKSQVEFRDRIEPLGFRFEVHTNAGDAFEAVKKYIDGPF